MTTGTTERMTTSKKEDCPEWHGDAATRWEVVVDGLRIPEAEDCGLNWTNDCNNGLDSNTRENGHTVRVIRDAAD